MLSFSRCAMGESVYNEIMNNKNDKQLQVSLDTINTITKLISNFIKYEYESQCDIFIIYLNW